jgi:hypothetical protein
LCASSSKPTTLSPTQRFDNISKLRTEFNGRKEYNDYTTVLPMVADAMKMARNQGATAPTISR